MQAGGRAPSGDLSPRARFSCKDGKTPIPIQGARYCHQLAQSRDGHCRAGVSWRPRSLHVFVGEPIALLFCGTRQTPRPRPPPKSSDKPRSLLAAAGGGGGGLAISVPWLPCSPAPLASAGWMPGIPLPPCADAGPQAGHPCRLCLGPPDPSEPRGGALGGTPRPSLPRRGLRLPATNADKKMGGTHLRPRFCTSCSSCVTLCSSEAMSAV